MDSNTRKALAQQLAQLPLNERNKLYKRASAQRKSDRRPGKEGQRSPSLDDVVLRLMAAECAPEADAGGELRQGTVVWVGSKTCRIVIEGDDVECLLQGQRPAPGDVATFSKSKDAHLLQAIAPRRTRLSRPDPGNAHLERVVAANVDAVVVVVSVKTPPLHPRLIDRYLIAIQYGGAVPILALNKIDLLNEDERRAELRKLEPYAGLEFPIVPVSTETGEGLVALQALLAGKLTAFAGHSGVGKSSLLNALHPDLGLATGEVSSGYGRGTHTTTASTLHVLPGGMRIIDTPGIRSFGLWDIAAGELVEYFPEFRVLACKYRDCSHLHEPGCGMAEAISQGSVHQARYETYRRLVEGEGSP